MVLNPFPFPFPRASPILFSRLTRRQRKHKMYTKMYMEVVMSTRYSIAEARSRLPGLLRDAEGGAAIEITRRGEPVAVVISAAEYRRIYSGRPSFREAFAAWSGTVDLDRIGLDRKDLAGLRDRSRGRKVKL
ncbi:MAG: type II toxin-antitoxin system prevent-host-death family antitoxin [Myxococcales bacterium]|nr:type II toxin-antitoxin system prevent-host-death family antitoxin [Myxococcales bacterium]